MQKWNISKLLFRCTIFDDLDLHIRIFSLIWLCFLTDVLFLMHIQAFSYFPSFAHLNNALKRAAN